MTNWLNTLPLFKPYCQSILTPVIPAPVSNVIEVQEMDVIHVIRFYPFGSACSTDRMHPQHLKDILSSLTLLPFAIGVGGSCACGSTSAISEPL